MKKLFLIGIIILICCSVFLIIRQNQSCADIAGDVYGKTYPVPFGDWVYVYLSVRYRVQGLPHFLVTVSSELIEGKTRFTVRVRYSDTTEMGRQFYRETSPKIKERIREQCAFWTSQGYPISLNDFEFDVDTF